MEKIRILFVDDDQAILDGLRRMLHPMHDQWHMGFVGNGQTALEMMAREAYDVIVSDMRMPGMNGAELLSKVKERHPKVIRIVLSGQSDISLLPQMLRVVHQFLSKPIESNRLISTVSRVYALKELLKNDTLDEVILQMETLPIYPTPYTELRDELNTPEPSTQRIGDIISRDMGLTLKVLQVVHSGFFASVSTTHDPRQVANVLGIDAITNIADLVTVLPEDDRSLFASPPLRDLWKHSLRAGQITKAIARVESLNQETTAEAYLAAFLHDVGKIILAVHLPDKYATMLSLIETRKMLQTRAEKHVFGVVHSDAGAFLLSLWGLPDSIVIPTACHHHTDRCQDRHMMFPTAIVHTANIFEHAATTGDWGNIEDHLNMEFLDKLGLRERLPIWREVSQSLIRAGEINDVG